MRLGWEAAKAAAEAAKRAEATASKKAAEEKKAETLHLLRRQERRTHAAF